MHLHQWCKPRCFTLCWSYWGLCVYYILLIWLSGQKLLVERLWGKTNRSNYLKSCQLWMTFFVAFLVVLVWMSCVSKHAVFAFQPWHLSASMLRIVDRTLKVLLKSILDIKLYSFCLFFLILDFLGRWTLNIGQNFCLQPSISTKTEFGLESGVKFPTRWVFLKNLKPEYALYFVFFVCKKLWLVVFIRYSFQIVMLMTQVPKSEYTNKIRFWQASILCSKKKKRDSVT